MSMIVLSDGLLSPKEMAYYQFQMEQNELPINDPNRVDWGELNFAEASYGKASLMTRLPNCPDNILVNSTPIPTNTYQVSNTIQSNTIVPNGNFVIFNAGNINSLEEGFEVQLGGTFEANIQGCD